MGVVCRDRINYPIPTIKEQHRQQQSNKMTNNNNIVEMAQGADATNDDEVINMIFPTVLVEQLEDLFEGDKIDFNKVLFTVYWINKGKWNGLKNKYESYQEVSSRYGNWISLVGRKGTVIFP